MNSKHNNSKTVEILEKELTELRIKMAEQELLSTQHNWNFERVRFERRKLDTIINCLPNGVSIISKDCKIQFQNRWSQKMFGNKIGKTCYKEFQGRNSACPNCPVKRAIAHNKIEECEITEKDGRYYRIIAAPMGEFAETLSGVEIVIDVTEQKLAEQVILDSKQKYVDLVNDLNAGIYRSTPGENGRLTEVNPAMVSMFEAKSKADLLSHKVGHLYQVPSKRNDVTSKLIKVGFVKDEEVALVTLKGREFWGSITSVKRADSNGNAYFEGIIEDITEHKKTEDAVRVSEERYRMLIENSGSSIIYFDIKGKVIFANKNAARDFGLADKSELIGKTLSKLFPKDQVKLFTERFARAINNKRGFSVEQLTVLPDGRHWFLAYIQPVKNLNGDIVGIQCVSTDITKRHLAEEKVKDLNKALQETNKQLKQLTLKDSHTDLYNHRYLEEIIETEFSRAKRYRHSISVILLDVDYFKSLNDVYGHQFGDLVLRQLANQLKKIVRQHDIVTRFGGEEFVIVSPRTNRADALHLAQRINTIIRTYNFGTKVSIAKLKISAAVASYPEDKINKGIELIAAADHILKKVKEDGGDRAYATAMADSRASECGSVDAKTIKTKIGKLNKRVNHSLIEEISAFGKLNALRDGYKEKDLEKTTSYAEEIAKTLKLTTEQVEQVKQAYLLRDLGKVEIEQQILQKKTRLNTSEQERIRQHTVIGVEILNDIPSLRPTLPAILYHHERWDGKGYPKGLSKEQAPIEARILAVVDTYQALICNRPYRKAYPKNQAIKTLLKNSGTQFDPTVVETFEKILQKETSDK